MPEGLPELSQGDTTRPLQATGTDREVKPSKNGRQQQREALAATAQLLCPQHPPGQPEASSPHTPPWGHVSEGQQRRGSITSNLMETA